MIKKFFIALFLIFVFISASFAEVSEDQRVHIRQDVFEAKMDALMSEVKLGHEKLRREMQEMEARLHGEIQSVKAELHDEIQAVKEELKAQIHSVEGQIIKLDGRLNATETMMGWILTALSIFAALIAGAPLIWELLPKIKNLFTFNKSESREDYLRNLIRTELEAMLKNSSTLNNIH